MLDGAPTPSQTLAVLFGASEFTFAPKLAQGKAFYNSATDFREYLVSKDGLGLPSKNIKSLFDDSRSPSEQLQRIGAFLDQRSAELKIEGNPPLDLIVFYVGHGLFFGHDQAYGFAVRETDERAEGLTSIRASDLASIIMDRARFLRISLIFDCCFSAAAAKEFQGAPLQAVRAKVLRDFPERGTALLCSASAHDPSLAPQGLSHTMFSSSLLKALRTGHRSFGHRLSLTEVYELVKVDLTEAFPDTYVRPEIHSPNQRHGDVSAVFLFPNPAFAEAATGEARPSPPRESGPIATKGPDNRGSKKEADPVSNEALKPTAHVPQPTPIVTTKPEPKPKPKPKPKGKIRRWFKRLFWLLVAVWLIGVLISTAMESHRRGTGPLLEPTNGWGTPTKPEPVAEPYPHPVRPSRK